MQTNLERQTGRVPGWVPGWARAWSRRRWLAAALVVLVVVVAAVSWGSGADGRAEVPVLSDGPDVGLTGVRSPSDERGGTLRVVAAEIDSLDPQRSYSPGVWNLMRLYTRTLVTFSTEPGSPGVLVPDLATDLGTTEDGGKTWTFTLREGVRFENGEPVLAKDVRYGIARLFASEVITGGPLHLVDLLDNPDNPYPGPYSREEGDPALTAISTPDDRTVVFRLRRKMPDFPYVLALPSASPVPSQADTGAAYAQDPLSSGPYAITSVDERAGIVLDRNPEWDPATDPVRTALPDRVVVRTNLSGMERDQALLAGSADVDISGTGVQAPTAVRIAADEDGELAGRVDHPTTGSVRMLAMPTTVPPMDTAPCRAAVAAAVDRGAVQDVLGGPGNAVRTSVLWPRALPGGPEDADVGPDHAAARAALAECGQPAGFTTVLAVADVSANVAIAEELSRQLAEVGITAEVRALPAEEFYVSEVGQPASVEKNGYGLILVPWTADLPTPWSFLEPLVHGPSIERRGNTNYANLDWDPVDEQISRARTAADDAEAAAAWREVAELAGGTHTYVPLVETRAQVIAGQRLRNGLVMRPYGSYDLATAGVR